MGVNCFGRVEHILSGRIDPRDGPLQFRAIAKSTSFYRVRFATICRFLGHDVATSQNSRPQRSLPRAVTIAPPINTTAPVAAIVAAYDMRSAKNAWMYTIDPDTSTPH